MLHGSKDENKLPRRRCVRIRTLCLVFIPLLLVSCESINKAFADIGSNDNQQIDGSAQATSDEAQKLPNNDSVVTAVATPTPESMSAKWKKEFIDTT
jgi:hypothetical protein